MKQITAVLNSNGDPPHQPGDLVRAGVLAARQATRLGLAASFLAASIQNSGLPFADEQAGRLVDRALALASVLLDRSERSEHA